MNRITHKVRLTSQAHYGRNAPPDALGEVLQAVPLAVRQSIRMGFQGRSTVRGRRPAWLRVISDIRLVDYQGTDDTVLVFEAPQFGEAHDELYQQPEFWPTKPPPDDTGFDLLGDVLADVAAEREDSDRFDRPLLRGLSHFQRGLTQSFQGIYLSGHRYAESQPAALTSVTLDCARRLYEETPLPQRVRLVGRLDMIWQSRQGFALTLDDGQEVRGVLVEGDVSECKVLFNQRVLVQGRAIYRPSGRLLRIDAERIDAGAGEPALWSRVPPPRGRKLDRQQFLQPQTLLNGVEAIFGKWPGDETDEEILDTLKRMG